MKEYNEAKELERLQANNIPVTLFITNGFQLRGTISAFDEKTVVLRADGKDSIIYKHAISTVQPHHK